MPERANSPGIPSSMRIVRLFGRVDRTSAAPETSTTETLVAASEQGPSDFGVGLGLNELTWVHAKPSAMEVDGRDEASQVSIAGGAALEGDDFAVESLGDGVGDVLAAVVHDVVQALADQTP